MKNLLNLVLILTTVLNQFVVLGALPVVKAQPAQVTAEAGVGSPAAVEPTAAQNFPAAPASRLSLKTNLTCVTPGQDLALDWDFQPAPEWANRENELELVLTLPEALTPAGETPNFNPNSRQARPAFAKSGKLQSKLAAQIPPALIVTARVMNGEKVVAETNLELGQGHRFDISARGGEAVTPDQRVKISFPQGALSEDITLCFNPKGGAEESRVSLIGHAFGITSEGKTTKTSVRQFGQPIAISYRVAEGEYAGDAANLSLMYYDEDLLRWRYLPTRYDPKQRTLTGYSTHLTDFLYDVNTIDRYKINDLSAFQVSEYSGAGTYALPLTLPPGPAGFAPSLTLGYNSAGSDAAGYHTQGSWVGLGWDLSVGQITRNENRTTSTTEDDTFTWQGQTLIPYQKGTDASGKPDTNGLTYIEYQAHNTQFARIRQYLRTEGDYHWQGYAIHNWEGYCGTRRDTSFWKVWDKEGVEYKFDERMVYPNYPAGYTWPCSYTVYDNYKWFLTTATHPSGQVITYTYEKTSAYRDLVQWATNADIEVVLHEIYYANNRYYVHFETGQERKDYEPGCLEAGARCAVDRKRLNAVRIYDNPNGSLATAGSLPAGAQLVRSYELSYASDANPVLYPYMPWLQEGNVLGYTLTLNSVVEKGQDGGALPTTNFTYSDNMHLTDVENGYKGKVHLSYETNPWPAAGAAGTEWGQAVSVKEYYNNPIAAPDTWGVRVSPSASYGKFVPVAPGKMIWMKAVVNITPQNINFRVSSGSWTDIQTNVYASGSGAYAVVLKMPQDIRDILSFRFGNSMEILEEQIGVAVTRYRVTQRTVYPDLNDPDRFYTYSYAYTDANGNDTASLNTPALSDISPQSDNVKEKVIHAPYSEFRGHGTVKVTRPDGSYTITHYYQTDALAGQMKDTTLYRADGHKISATILGNGTSGSDYHQVTIPSVTSGANQVVLPRCGTETCKDAKIYWTAPRLVEKRIYNVENDSQYAATRTESSYVLDANGKPVYGEVRSVSESEWSGSAWTVKRKQILAYTGTDVNTDARYFVGHPSTTALCSANGSESNAEYQACGLNPADYYGFSSYYYTTLGQPWKVVNLLYFTGTPTTNYTNRASDYTQYSYDNYGNVKTVGKGYKDPGQNGVVTQTTAYCYRPVLSDCNAVPEQDTPNALNGVYLQWVTNARGQVTRYEYDQRLGQATKQTDPNAAETVVTYDEFGRPLTVRKPGDFGAGVAPTLQFSYHPPESGVSPYFWTEATQKLADSGAEVTYTDFKVRKFYNGIGELIQTQQVGVKVDDPACGATTCTVVTNQKTEYINGVMTTTQAAPYVVATPSGYSTPPTTWANVTVSTFDEQGRPLKVKAPGQTDTTSQRFSYAFDTTTLAGQTLLKTTATDPADHYTYTWQDVWGRTVRRAQGALVQGTHTFLGPILVYNYDPANRLTSVEQRNSSSGATLMTTSLVYDIAGRKLQMTDPDMGTWAYAYDALGNLTRQQDARGQRICLYYDALNRLTGKHYRTDNNCPSTSPSLNVSYTYDSTASGNKGVGRRTGMSNLVGGGGLSNTSSWTYDLRGRVTAEYTTITDGTNSWGPYTVSTQTYDSADRVTSLTYPSGEVVKYDYLPQGQVQSVESPSTSYNQVYLANAAVDEAGRVTMLERGNGTKTLYTYNEWSEQGGRLSKIETGLNANMPVNPTLQKLSYTYDLVGNITQITDGLNSNQNQCFTYDEANRLTRARTRDSAGCGSLGDAGAGTYDESYAYDPANGNLSSKAGLSYAYDSAHPHAVAKVGTGSTPQYTYDANGNMVTRIVGTTNYTLSYDAENRLVSLSGGTLSVTYVYDGDGKQVLVKKGDDKVLYVSNLFEMPYTGSVLQAWRSYYYAGAARIAMRYQPGSGTQVSWLYADHLGSTTCVVAAGSSSCAEQILYKAWGERRGAGGNPATDYRYTGQREADAGLYFYNARWYDPALGRFAQADSLIPEPGKAVGFDRYAYVNNNPVNANDPSGHFRCIVESNTSGYTEEQCVQDIEEYLRLLETRGGNDGRYMERMFRGRDNATYCHYQGACENYNDQVTFRIVQKFDDGSSGGYDNNTGEISFLASDMMGFRGTEQDKLVGAGVLVHEVKHMQQGALGQASYMAEIEAYTTQYKIYETMGVTRSAPNNEYVITASLLGNEAGQESLRTQIEIYEHSNYANLPVIKILWWMDSVVRAVLKTEYYGDPSVITSGMW